MNVLPEWVNLNKTFLKFFPPPVFLPEVLCERGVLAVAWWTRVPLHRGRRAHIWVWCSGRYSWMQRMSSPVFTHFRTADWLKTEERKCLNEQRKRLTHHHRFTNENGNSERSIMLCVSKKTLCKHIFHLSLRTRYQISQRLHRPHIYLLFLFWISIQPFFTVFQLGILLHAYSWHFCLCKMSSLQYKVDVKENQTIYQHRRNRCTQKSLHVAHHVIYSQDIYEGYLQQLIFSVLMGQGVCKCCASSSTYTFDML